MKIEQPRTRSCERKPWKNPIVKEKGNPAYWPAEAVPGKPLPEMTQQHHKEACNINRIIDKVLKTGRMELLQEARGFYADVSNLPKDYHAAMNQLNAAQQAFQNLPSGIRNEFQNDPGKLLAAIKDPKQKDRLIELGVINKPQAATGKPPEAPKAANPVPEQPKP